MSSMTLTVLGMLDYVETTVRYVYSTFGKLYSIDGICIALLQITIAELPKDFGKSHISNKPSIPFGTMLKGKDSSAIPTSTSLSLQPSTIEHQGTIISTMTIRVTTVYHSTTQAPNSISKPSSISDSGVMMIGETLNSEFWGTMIGVWLCVCLGITNI
ncbi:32219_t:CDS:2 [Gigaspora margarita]|uniref:32219_t:CDS:1 n=1 Tax=Gigaspora margarita TaxID=4874 RepID=A0ABN7VF57_GIGMA|nr:32219_t:CDS:2 [Gigaspora margarita]